MTGFNILPRRLNFTCITWGAVFTQYTIIKTFYFFLKIHDAALNQKYGVVTSPTATCTRYVKVDTKLLRDWTMPFELSGKGYIPPGRVKRTEVYTFHSVGEGGG